MNRQERLNRKEEMKRLRFELGWSYQEIGDKFNVSRQRVYQIIGKSGFFSGRERLENHRKAEDAIATYPHLYLPEINKLTGINIGILYKVRYKMGITNIDKRKRFWSFVDMKNDSVCWEWQRHRNSISDYGMLSFLGNTTRYAHRAAWEFSNGKIPKGKHVLHTCDNPPCVNPAHLYIGTPQDNMDDRTERGKSIGAVLSTKKAREIKQLDRDGLSLGELSKLFGVTKGSIYKVLNGTTYQQL